MNEHYCLLCMGSNTNRFTQLSDARKALSEAFPDIHFGELMETEAIGSGFHSPFSNQLASFTTALPPGAVHDLFKVLEHRSGRLSTDKAAGIVKLDIDLLMYDNVVLKPEDMKREYIKQGLTKLRACLNFPQH